MTNEEAFEKYFPKPVVFKDKAHELETLSKWYDAKINWELSLQAAIAYMQEQSEPVAWKYKTNKVHTWITEVKPPDDAYDDGTLTPLYTSPQPIGKCEPVGEVDVDGFGMKEIRWKGYHWTHILRVGDKLYTSPQPRDWVSLSDGDIRDVFRKFGWTANQVDFEDARAIEAKLKQLNTKG